jgi:hypothetical protein
MTADENKRISSLTTGAIKTTTDSAIKAMIAAVEAAEEKTAEMRAAVEEYVKEFEGVTDTLANHVAAHVASCQAAIDSFQAHHLKILNVEAAPLPEPILTVKEEAEQTRAEAPRTLPRPVDLDSELGKLRALTPAVADGRR